jgi:hypothetical protein
VRLALIMAHGWLKLSGVFLSVALAGRVTANPSDGRLAGTFEGIECEYSPGREELARLLARRFAMHNQEMAAVLAIKKPAATSVVPLSPAEMRADRSSYLGGITRQLGMEKPTALQEECYDAFLDNYEEDMELYALMRECLDTFQVIKRFTIWDRDELIRQLSTGDKIAGFTYDPVTHKGDVTFGTTMNRQDDRFKDLAAKREKLHRTYAMSIGQENGRTVYRGSVSPKKPTPTPGLSTAAVTPPVETGKSSELLPVIIPSDLANLSAVELAPKLWDGRDDDSLITMLGYFARMKESIPLVDPTLAFVVLHETTELGIMDHYFHGPDRRWFCDGVANYMPWRVVRDLHGTTVATTVYNLADQLVRSAPMREQADLRKWPATEKQTEDDQHSELNSARYAFAANAVFLMHAHAGEDILPRLFGEIGKTKPDKVSIKTVEKAWKKLTGIKLDTILAEAVKPMPTSTVTPPPVSPRP